MYLFLYIMILLQGVKMNILNEASFKEKISDNNSGKIVVQMSTDWCAPCKTMKKMMSSLSSTLEGISLNYLDIGQCSNEFANIFNIKSVPTTVFFDNGRILYTHTGVPGTKESLSELITNTYSIQGE